MSESYSIHIHHFVEDGHGMALWDGSEDWSFHCTKQNCPVGLSLLYDTNGFSVKSIDLSEFYNRRNESKKHFLQNIKDKKGCTRCGWEPPKSVKGNLRQMRMRNHRKRAHHI